MKTQWRVAIGAMLSGGAMAVSLIAASPSAHAVTVSDAWMKAWSSGTSHKTANLTKKTSTDVGANYRNSSATQSTNLQNKNGQGTTVSKSAGFTIAMIQLCKQDIPFLPMNCGEWRTS